MRRAAASDANQPEVVAALRAAGCSVVSLHRVGQGCPDLLAGKDGKNVLIEVKDGSKPPSKRLLTEDQVEFHASWRGQIAIVKSAEDALRLFGVIA